ncbi:hypothetical protein WS45_19575 [Burkholderia sp. RF2-non_BP3]|nr:hypothetical protein WS45_19575 [Burkholderia sp. RF2-non_BP3]
MWGADVAVLLSRKLKVIFIYSIRISGEERAGREIQISMVCVGMIMDRCLGGGVTAIQLPCPLH